MLINQELISMIANGARIEYLFTFAFANFVLRLTTSDEKFICTDGTYYSGIYAKMLSFASITTMEEIEAQIINEYCGRKISLEELLQSKVDIKLATTDVNQKATISDLWHGSVSKVDIDNGIFNIVISPSVEQLNQSIGELYSPICRECFGSKKCGVNIENYKTFGEITAITSGDCFVGTHHNNKSVPTGYYKYGLVRFLSGKLASVCLQIKDEQDGSIFLLKTTNLIAVGDRYEIFAGCDKTLTTCKKKFHNVVNFRGEPFIG